VKDEEMMDVKELKWCRTAESPFCKKTVEWRTFIDGSCYDVALEACTNCGFVRVTGEQLKAWKSSR